MAGGRVDWAEVDRRLPMGMDPESRKHRQILFDTCNQKGKTLSLHELKEAFSELMERDSLGASLAPCIKNLDHVVRFAWIASKDLGSKKPKKGGKISRTEFHGFLSAFRAYLEIAEIFESMDDSQEDNQKLSLRECRNGLPQLQSWGITEEIMVEQFKGVDAWVSVMKFSDFTKWCMNTRGALQNLQLDDSDNEEVAWEQARANMIEAADIEHYHTIDDKDDDANKRKISDTFQEWDTGNTGYISADELAAVLMSLDPTMTRKEADNLFAAADGDNDEKLDYEEFSTWIFG